MNPPNMITLTDWSVFFGALFVIVSTTIATTLWLNSQFTLMKDFIRSQDDQTRKEILNKLEYHEQHDDQRFRSIDNEMWAIKVRNASRDRELAVENAANKIIAEK